ncbi:helix-turn-helix domain-containing protein [Nocardiopsis aegyptia]|nr:Scr1 family TA system antitoxin-like transcriptional regulator [Nocardiopsis aegyptia]
MPPNVFTAELIRSRKALGMTQTQLARSANISLSSLNRWEQGGSLPRRENAERLDHELRTEGRLLARFDEAKDGFTVPPWARDLVSIETAARTVHVVALALVPGYLQSPLYASMLFRASRPWAPDAEIGRLVRLRCQRLEQLPDLRVTAVFPVSAIDSLPPEIRTEQVAALQRWVSTGRVTLHLVPHESLLLVPTAPVMVFQLENGEQVISSDHATGSVVAETSMHPRLTSMVSTALAAALPSRMSLEVLEGLT